MIFKGNKMYTDAVDPIPVPKKPSNRVDMPWICQTLTY